ncbi:ribulokinase [Metabacillus idriensis]|uniref:ribulokinase n=1 Tax=Metabacillus idriensis TaxID=324768 RepID=UPI00174ACA5F|nr:ribulokinase [Metabacillus idriensis]
MEKKFVIGVDFGTESARALLVDTHNGEIVASSVSYYPNGVITENLPDSNISLPLKWALQHPRDYLHSLKESIRSCMGDCKVNREDIVGLAIDFTASTILPVKESGIPLCFDDTYKNNPHSWVKLWKHHSSDREAILINETAFKKNESFIKRYGGEISEEWMFPKILQILNEAPEIFSAADKFIEAGDWIVWQLTGEEKRSSCMAGYKGAWSKNTGYPSKGFLKTLDSRMENVVEEKLSQDIYSVGTTAGFLTTKMSEYLNLTEKVAISVGIIDAHAAVIGAGISEPETMVMAMGTSICHLCMDEKEVFVPGISGVVADGIIPGLYAYEAGQSAGGDTFAWFIKNCVPKTYIDEAELREISIYQLIEEKAEKLKIGESGILALDWWNGNRSVLKDPNLTGTILGLTLQTKPEDIFRALMESLAFGTNKIIKTFYESGIRINKLYAVGGLAEKNKLLMQMLADITNKEVHVVTLPHASGMGAAVLAAVAAGEAKGGYKSIEEAIKYMIHFDSKVYTPISENIEKYKKLYSNYETLYKFFGENSDVMKSVLNIQRECKYL